MLYAVISDIHSNLEALTASLSEIDRIKADRIVCLGDIVGYNPNPNECIELLRERNIQCVMGNHDSRVAGLEDAADFNLLAARSIEWTRGVLTPENREFLAALPRSRFIDGRFLAIHGGVNDTDQYIFGARDALRNFNLMRELKKQTRVCFYGHTHVHAAFVEKDGEAHLLEENELKLEKGFRYLLNPGAIGQPRDRDPRASFALYDTDASLVSFRRLDYDIQRTAASIVEAGLPERLAERLKLGW